MSRRSAKLISLVVKAGALFFIVFLPTPFAINLQLLGGVWIIQILPAVVVGLYTRWFHRWALLVGWAVGMITGTAMAVSQNFASVYPLQLFGTTIARLRRPLRRRPQFHSRDRRNAGLERNVRLSRSRPHSSVGLHRSLARTSHIKSRIRFVGRHVRRVRGLRPPGQSLLRSYLAARSFPPRPPATS